MDKMEKRDRGRPEKLTDNLKRWIARCKDRHPGWSAAIIHKKLAEAILIDRKARYPGLSSEELSNKVKASLPGLSRVQKYLTEIQHRLKGTDELDRPWHLGDLLKYPLPSEAIIYIMLVQKYAEEYPDRVFKQPQSPVTIRQARWIARLYSMIGDIYKPKDKEKVNKAAFLYDWSKCYATHEIICAVSKTPFDTTELDTRLRKGGSPLVTDKQWVIFDTKDRSFTVDPKTAEQFDINGRKTE